MPFTLTIFTPAYNRAHLLPRLYESLCRQSCKDFCWLVIDDGSTDNTRELVQGWIAEQSLPIRYEYKPNGGMHTAHNLAYRLSDTELNTCIDSDDYMPDDAVEKILRCWSEKGSNDVSGLVGLDATANGKIIGTLFPAGRERMTLTDFTVRRLREPLFAAGKRVAPRYSLAEIAAYRAREQGNFWEEYLRQDMPHIYKVDLSDELYRLKKQLVEQFGAQ